MKNYPPQIGQENPRCMDFALIWAYLPYPVVQTCHFTIVVSFWALKSVIFFCVLVCVSVCWSKYTTNTTINTLYHPVFQSFKPICVGVLIKSTKTLSYRKIIMAICPCYRFVLSCCVCWKYPLKCNWVKICYKNIHGYMTIETHISL